MSDIVEHKENMDLASLSDKNFREYIDELSIKHSTRLAKITEERDKLKYENACLRIKLKSYQKNNKDKKCCIS